MKTVSLVNLGVDFPIFSAQSLSLRNALVKKVVGGRFKTVNSSIRVVNALNNINLDVYSGDRVGLIGHNGSGKSTLLRTLAGIYPPTSGEIKITGKVATLFGTTVAANQEMTGYENLFLNSLIFTGDYKQTMDQLESMAEFTELGEYLQLPMNTYSEGMKVRVGFASATNIAPDILLIDEIFGAGDKDFTEKSNQRMKDLIEKSNTLFLATHSVDLIKMFCNKVLWLEHGEIKYFGETNEVLDIYSKS